MNALTMSQTEFDGHTAVIALSVVPVCIHLVALSDLVHNQGYFTYVV